MINYFRKINFKRIGGCSLILFHFTLTAQINCENDTLNLVPLIDLQTGFYMGHQGGLYPEGLNVMPAAHADSGIAIAQSILPINKNGDEDTIYGKLVMVSIGPIDAAKSFNKFIASYNGAGYNDSCFMIINACIDNYGLDDMISPDADDLFWDELGDKLDQYETKRKQVQIAWLMSASFSDTVISFSSYVDSLANKYIDVIRRMKQEFINLKLIYISGLHYGGYISPDAEHLNALTEPAPYYNDFAIQSAIAAQINGDTLLNYSGDDAHAAWVAWGPNFWTDGRNPRLHDDLRWLCPGDFDLEEDGYFLDGTGQQKIADALLNFFTTDPTSTPWIYGLNYGCLPDTITYTDSTFIPDDEILWIAPNPVREILHFTLNLTSNEKADVAVYNLAGEKIKEGTFYKIEPGKEFTIKLSQATRGLYLLSVFVEGKIYNLPFYLDN
jgi:hypothetical protein